MNDMTAGEQKLVWCDCTIKTRAETHKEQLLNTFTLIQKYYLKTCVRFESKNSSFSYAYV